jgi:hypothetical protein
LNRFKPSTHIPPDRLDATLCERGRAPAQSAIGPAPPSLDRTFSRSRKPSPTKLMASTVAARKMPGNRMIQNASCTYERPSAMMLPQDGMTGGVPAPRNER